MKRVTSSIVGFSIAVLLTSCAARTSAQISSTATYSVGESSYAGAGYTATATSAPANVAPAVAATADAWPVEVNSGGYTCTIFEPQSDSWDGHQLVARSAVAVRTAPSGQPTYGVVSFSAITLVDKSAQTARLADIKLQTANFPSAPAQAPQYQTLLQQVFAEREPVIALDHLQTSFVTPERMATGEPLNNIPPRVIVATRPAILVYVDGPPAWRPVAGTSLERAINSHDLLLKDQSGRCYLHLFDGYLDAPSLDGPWSIAGAPPAGASTAEAQAAQNGTDLLPGEPDGTSQRLPSLSMGPAPEVFVATSPSELIIFNGQPSFVAIPGTQLLYAANTSGNVFKSLSDQRNYILISGRWFSAATLDGPWQFEPGNKLPRDFANIPDDSPKENVKASVPGTMQAQESLIANSIPQSTEVPRSTQMQPPQMDGAMQLAPIEGTPLHYIANSGTPIIEVIRSPGTPVKTASGTSRPRPMARGRQRLLCQQLFIRFPQPPRCTT